MHYLNRQVSFLMFQSQMLVEILQTQSMSTQSAKADKVSILMSASASPTFTFRVQAGSAGLKGWGLALAARLPSHSPTPPWSETTPGAELGATRHPPHPCHGRPQRVTPSCSWERLQGTGLWRGTPCGGHPPHSSPLYFF